MTKPLVLTSPNNAKSVGLDLALVIAGISYLKNPDFAPAMVAYLGDDRTALWGVLLSLGALVSAVAAITAAIAYCKYRLALGVEAGAAAFVALLMAFYGYVIVFHSAQPNPPVLLAVFAAAYLCRGGQAVHDLVRDRRSRRAGKTTSREVLADPKAE